VLVLCCDNFQSLDLVVLVEHLCKNDKLKYSEVGEVALVITYSQMIQITRVR
jgi:hypothetical protein